MSAPVVSVVMPVHNAAPYLTDSIGSILGQTLRDFELVVLENGSSDESRSILERYAEADPRVRLFDHPRPLGVVRSTNYVVSRSTAPLVARMDADDVCRPDRLVRQVEVMRAPDVVAVGTLADGIDARGRRVRPRDRWRLIHSPEVPFVSGSIMFRRSAFDRLGGFREGTPLGRDVEFILRLADCGRIVVLPDGLYRVRYHLGSTTLTSSLPEIARSKESLHRSFEERRAGRAHEHVSARPRRETPRSESMLVALRYQGAMRLWAGEPPGILCDVVRNGSARSGRAWLMTLVWAFWARVSPATLRLFLRCLVRARDLLAGLRFRDGRAYEWRLT